MSEDNEPVDASETLRDLGQYLITLAESFELSDNNLALPAIPLPAKDGVQHGVDDLPKLSRLAYREYQDRSKRAAYFDLSLFGEPAWDLLLDLFIARVSGLRISITSACIAAQVPSTTALRWLKVLERRGLIVRDGDELDQRRSWVELTDRGFQDMAACLRERGRRRATEIKDFAFATRSPIPRRS